MIERLERTDPTKPLELVTYDEHGNEIGRKSPTGFEVLRVRRREAKPELIDGRTIGCTLNFPIEWP